MKLTEEDIKTLRKIEKYCMKQKDCEKCIFNKNLECAIGDVQTYWDLEAVE